MGKFNPFDYFFILRPLILIPVWNFLLIGSFIARGKSGFTPEILIALLIYTFVMGGTYILNQIVDIESDRINKKLFLLSEGYIKKESAFIELFLLWGLAIILALQFGREFLLLISFSIILGIGYSVPPFKFKARPFLDTLANGFGYGIINFTVGWLLFRDLTPTVLYRFFPYFLSISAVFINTTIVDIEGDKRSGAITTGVFLGPRLSHLFATFLLAGAVISAFMLRDLVCLIPAVVSMPLFVYTTIYAFIHRHSARKYTIASFRLPGIIFTLITAYLYPPYIIFLILLFWAMRFYYKRRFGITYPTLAR
ncbi:hypothetical protein BXT86_03725 [candidate division WOR-3 bacterium 4484_100]|uniref:Prenyltransferase n=1 Tax=candidate division WOR-3 bacterium 4484_100 TaxID=1936077 RepID=A0A1V4QG25_UNCW3|nr:MAG: hypothetical protein BXT86_03725 [candidate division WOR-3 bacterium 4484_100]